MFCSKCGSSLNEGEKFCSVCGEKVETAPMQQNQAQPYGVQQPYGQQPYGRPYGQPPKRSKAGLVITLSLIAVLAIAAVALFLWPGYLTFGANTMQMKFISDNAQVFTDAFSDMSSQADKDNADKPFDITMKMNVDISGLGLPSQEVTMDMAYDEETLGLSEDLGYSKIKMLLLGDVLYIETFGETTGIKFSSDEDLSKPMKLKERLTAVFNGIVKDLGRDLSDTEVDWTKLLNMMVNSIDESNFKQTGSATTLTLDADAIIDTVKTFRDSLSKDKKLLKDLESFIKGISGQKTDVLEELDDAIKDMEKTKDDADFEITWTVYYEGGRPTSIVISIDSEGEKVEFSFGYENTKNGKDVSFVIDTPGDSSDVRFDYNYQKDGNDIDFTASIVASGQTIGMSGSIVQDGDNMQGEMTIEIGGQTVKTTFDGTVKYGMPDKKVKDDKRFEIDTDKAMIYSVSDLVEKLGTGMFGPTMPGVSDFDAPLIPNDFSSENNSTDYAWMDLNGVWEVQGAPSGGASEGTALLFKEGSVYVGQSGASEGDILNDTAGVRGTKDGAMYFLMGETLTIYNLDGTSVDMYWDGLSLWSSDGTEFVPRADATVKTY